MSYVETTQMLDDDGNYQPSTSPSQVVNSIINFTDTAQEALVDSTDALKIKFSYCLKIPTKASLSYKISDSEIRSACYQSLSNTSGFSDSDLIISEPELTISYTITDIQDDDYDVSQTSTTSTTQAPSTTEGIQTNVIPLLNKGDYWTTYNKDVVFSGTTDGTQILTVTGITSNEVITPGMIIIDAGSTANINNETIL